MSKSRYHIDGKGIIYDGDTPMFQLQECDSLDPIHLNRCSNLLRKMLYLLNKNHEETKHILDEMIATSQEFGGYDLDE